MKVVVAENSGFCWGVKMAFETVETLVERRETPVQTYGDLVHNPDVMAFLGGKGVVVANSIDGVIEGAHVVVRAHGIPDREMKLLKEKTPHVYDGMCPTVGALKKWAGNKVKAGYFAVVLGKPDHPEMVCVTGDLPERSYAVVESLEAARQALGQASPSRVYFCSQTTRDPVSFTRMAEELNLFCNGKSVAFEAKDTTCRPTGKAKRFAEDLARASDLMVIIGGANSSNTKGLVTACEGVYAGSGGRVIHVENVSGLEKYFKAGSFNAFEKVGIAAGTSTPPWVIEDVCNRLMAYR